MHLTTPLLTLLSLAASTLALPAPESNAAPTEKAATQLCTDSGFRGQCAIFGGADHDAECIPLRDTSVWHNVRSIRMGPKTTCAYHKGEKCDDRQPIKLEEGQHRDNVGSYYQPGFKWDTSISSVQCYSTG